MEENLNVISNKDEQEPRGLGNIFGRIQSLIDDDDLTDIKVTPQRIWVDHISKGVYADKIRVTEEEIMDIAYKVSNAEGKPFNQVNPVLEADYDDLRLQILHSSVATSGANMTIRKTPFVQRINPEKIGETGYANPLLTRLFREAIKEGMSFVVGGETGAGKTELVKLLCRFVPKTHSIITVEDTSELHLTKLFPEKNVIELKLNDNFSHTDAIRSALRMNPDWVLLSEARGEEIAKLMEARSTGHGIITTLHFKGTELLAERIINMYGNDNRPSDEQITDMVFDYFDFVVHIGIDKTGSSTLRYINQVSCYTRESKDKREITTIYKRNKDGTIDFYPLPRLVEEQIRRPKLIGRWDEECQKTKTRLIKERD